MSSATEDAKKQQAVANEARKQGIPEWQREMANSVDDALVRDLVSDFRRGPSLPSSMAAKPATVEEKRPSFTEPAPLDVPGIKLVDQIADHFAKLDQAEKVKQALELAAMSKRSEKMK